MHRRTRPLNVRECRLVRKCAMCVNMCIQAYWNASKYIILQIHTWVCHMWTKMCFYARTQAHAYAGYIHSHHYIAIPTSVHTQVMYICAHIHTQVDLQHTPTRKQRIQNKLTTTSCYEAAFRAVQVSRIRAFAFACKAVSADILKLKIGNTKKKFHGENVLSTVSHCVLLSWPTMCKCVHREEKVAQSRALTVGMLAHRHEDVKLHDEVLHHGYKTVMWAMTRKEGRSCLTHGMCLTWIHASMHAFMSATHKLFL